MSVYLALGPIFGALAPFWRPEASTAIKNLLSAQVPFFFYFQHPKIGPTMAKLPKMWKIHEQVNEIVLTYYQ